MRGLRHSVTIARAGALRGPTKIDPFFGMDFHENFSIHGLCWAKHYERCIFLNWTA